MDKDFEQGVKEDLRTRRRHETALEICEAALTLFEAQGVTSTTVDEIAERAGISARTFFRQCRSKEEAILIDDGKLADALIEAAGPATGVAEATARLSRVWADELRQLDEDHDAHERYLRVRRLVRTEPTLLAAAVRRDIEHAEVFIDALEQRAGLPRLTARVIAERAWTVTRLALDEWVRRIDDGQAPRLDALYAEVDRLFATVGP